MGSLIPSGVLSAAKVPGNNVTRNVPDPRRRYVWCSPPLPGFRIGLIVVYSRKKSGKEVTQFAGFRCSAISQGKNATIREARYAKINRPIIRIEIFYFYRNNDSSEKKANLGQRFLERTWDIPVISELSC